MMDDKMTDIAEKIAALFEEKAGVRPEWAVVLRSEWEGVVEHIRALEQERDTTATDLYDELMDTRKERDAAQAELKRLRAQEPVAWKVVAVQGFTRCILEREPDRTQFDMGETFVPLYTEPKPAKE